MPKHTSDSKLSLKGAQGLQSVEILNHFRCGSCNKWWSVADAPIKKEWFCPWCGVKQLFKTE